MTQNDGMVSILSATKLLRQPTPSFYSPLMSSLSCSIVLWFSGWRHPSVRPIWMIRMGYPHFLFFTMKCDGCIRRLNDDGIDRLRIFGADVIRDSKSWVRSSEAVFMCLPCATRLLTLTLFFNLALHVRRVVVGEKAGLAVTQDPQVPTNQPSISIIS